jgi:hypothetical protein
MNNKFTFTETLWWSLELVIACVVLPTITIGLQQEAITYGDIGKVLLGILLIVAAILVICFCGVMWMMHDDMLSEEGREREPTLRDRLLFVMARAYLLCHRLGIN